MEIPPELLALLPEEKREPLRRILAQDPRPSYQKDPGRIYGFPFAGFEIRFVVSEGELCVRSISPAEKSAE